MVGDDTASGLMFADGFVGVSETPDIAETNRKGAINRIH